MRARSGRRVPGASPGFTLLEVLVALSILAMAVTVVLQLFSANLRSVGASEDYVAASIRAEAKMREVLDDDELGEGDRSEVTEDGYRIDVSVTETSAERTENLQVTLYDVKVTLLWKKGEKERVQILRTLKVMPKKI